MSTTSTASRPLPESRRPRPSWARGELIAVAGLCTGALALRVYAASSELWVDELWSLWTVRQLSSPWDLLTADLTRNNHPLYSLYLMALTGLPSPWMMRAPSILAGSFSPILAFLALRPLGRACAVLGGIVVAVSTVGVVYGSEARGYSLCVAMMLSAALVVARGAALRLPVRTPALALLCAIGALSHLQFVGFQAALLVGTAWAAQAEERREQLRLQLPAAFLSGGIAAQQLVTLAWVPGPPTDWVAVVSSSFALALGSPGGARTNAVIGSIAAILGLRGVVILARRGCPLWLASALIAFAIPVALAILDPDQLVERFMLLPIVVLQLLCVVTVCDLLTRSSPAKACAIALLAAFVGGTALDLARFAAQGRGNVQGAFAFIEEQSDRGEIRVGSDQDFPAGLALSYYRESAARIRFVRHEDWPSDGVDWLLIWRGANDDHRLPGSPPAQFGHEILAELAAPTPAPSVSDAEGRRFVFERHFPAHRLSGLDVFVYRRAP